MAGVAVFAGRFASQPLAFAHLLDAADRAGIALDLDHVEVICGGDPARRLAHVFAPADVETIRTAKGGDDTLVLVFPEALIPGARLFADTDRLRPLGIFPPTPPRLWA